MMKIWIMKMDAKKNKSLSLCVVMTTVICVAVSDLCLYVCPFCCLQKRNCLSKEGRQSHVPTYDASWTSKEKEGKLLCLSGKRIRKRQAGGEKRNSFACPCVSPCLSLFSPPPDSYVYCFWEIERIDSHLLPSHHPISFPDFVSLLSMLPFDSFDLKDGPLCLH